MTKRAKKLWLVAVLCSALCLTACAKNDGSFDVKQTDGKKASLRLMDVWQDDAQCVMVTLAGTDKGKLLDVAATAAGRHPMPKVQVRILVDGKWLESTDYPQGMYYTENNGLLTIRYPATNMPEQIDISGTVLKLEGLKLPGVDRPALLLAEKMEKENEEQRERQKAEAMEQILREAVFVAPKAAVDTGWMATEPLAAGESIYYACTGLEKADAAGVSFILSADGKSVRDIRVQVINAQGDRIIQTRRDYLSKMQYSLQNGRLNVETDGVYLDVTLEGGAATGVFRYGIESGETLFGTSYESCGTARIEMEKVR